MDKLVITTSSAHETQELGRRLGARLTRGDLILLNGTLGSGKTTLTQGIAWGAGVTGYAHSPTFVLVNEYAGRIPIYHADLYRLEGSPDEVEDLRDVEELAFDDMLARGACVVEWAGRAGGSFPGGHLAISLVAPDEGPVEDRTVTLVATEERHRQLLDAVAKDLGPGAGASRSKPSPV